MFTRALTGRQQAMPKPLIVNVVWPAHFTKAVPELVIIVAKQVGDIVSRLSPRIQFVPERFHETCGLASDAETVCAPESAHVE